MQTGIDQRRHRRYNLAIPVQVRSKTHPVAALQASTQDISAKGVYFTLSEGVELGSELEFELALPAELCQGKNVRVRCRGKIVRVGRPDQDGKVGVGAAIEQYEFVRMD